MNAQVGRTSWASLSRLFSLLKAAFVVSARMTQSVSIFRLSSYCQLTAPLCSDLEGSRPDQLSAIPFSHMLLEVSPLGYKMHLMSERVVTKSSHKAMLQITNRKDIVLFTMCAVGCFPLSDSWQERNGISLILFQHGLNYFPSPPRSCCSVFTYYVFKKKQRWLQLTLYISWRWNYFRGGGRGWTTTPPHLSHMDFPRTIIMSFVVPHFGERCPT